MTVIVILANVFGNFALSWGMKHEPVGPASWALYLKTMFSPWVLTGVLLLIVWLLTRMTLLSWADLSFVLPVTSVGYVMTLFIGKYFFAEQISWYRWLGTLFVIAGMIVVGTTSPRTTPAHSAQDRN